MKNPDPVKTLFLMLASTVLLNACQNSSSGRGPEDTSTEEATWQVIGPGGGGGVLKPTISPLDENLVMTHCDMTAAYLTKDGGENWQMKNLWNVPEDFEFDPHDPNTIYVATKGFRHSEDRGSGISTLLRTEDRGERWEIVYPNLDRILINDLLQTTDLLPSEIMEGAIDGTINKVKVEPADKNQIYLGMSPLRSYIGRGDQNGEDSVMLVHSTDHGVSWKLRAKIPGLNVKAIIPCSTHGVEGEVVVITESACSRIVMKTGAITQFPVPTGRIVAAESGNDKDGAVIYLQTRFEIENGQITGGMYVSRDLGASWIPANNGLLNDIPEGLIPSFRQGLAVCETQPSVAYISTIHPVRNSNGDREMIYSVYKTVNGGNEWNPVLLSSTPRGYITDNFAGSWMEVSFDPGWGGSPIDLAVAPGNPDVCYAGDNGRGYKTSDGGKTWEQVYSHIQPDGSYANNGLNVTTCYGVHFDPFNKDHFFICYTDMGLFHTLNGGESWFHSLDGIPRPWQNTCYDLTFDPEVEGRVWSVWANAHDLPRDKMFGRSGFNRFQGGVAISEDGGLNWAKSNHGMPGNTVCTAILLDPTSSSDSRTLYVGVFDKGVYKSMDGGKNWQEANTGLGDNLFVWKIRQNSLGHLFVLSARGKRNGETVNGSLYYSDNQAASWTKLDLPEGVNGPHDLMIDPDDQEIMYLSCWPRITETGDASGGVYKTVDGGKSWKQVFDERIRVNNAGMDPNHPEVLFINTFHNAAFRSDDSGQSWRRLEGYRFKWGQQAIPDINHPGMLFLTTYGGSVFYGPAEGIPGAFEDITNMPEGWW